MNWLIRNYYSKWVRWAMWIKPKPSLTRYIEFFNTIAKGILFNLFAYFSFICSLSRSQCYSFFSSLLCFCHSHTHCMWFDTRPANWGILLDTFLFCIFLSASSFICVFSQLVVPLTQNFLGISQLDREMKHLSFRSSASSSLFAVCFLKENFKKKEKKTLNRLPVYFFCEQKHLHQFN